MSKSRIIFAMCLYCVFAIATLLLWEVNDINTVTGDEPHYLVMSNGILKTGSFEQTIPYKTEFETREIYRHGLAPSSASPSPENTHAVYGPNGLFNVHNIGLPLLLVFPFLIGGVVGAKLFMIFISSLVVFAAWNFSSQYSLNVRDRFWTIVSVTMCVPLIPAANQIFPDVSAGLIAMTGLYWFSTIQQKKSIHRDLLLATTVVFLPWLQIKFAATCVVIILAVVIKVYMVSKDLKRVTLILFIAGSSCLLLMWYNYYAFGKISGPYQSGALQVSKTSLMVFLGLLFDQNQGILFQNPVTLIGLLSLGWMYKLNRTFFFVWALVFLSLIVPNALHPVWYGGFSFSGRFQWSAAIVYIIPTIYGLLVIAARKKNLFNAIILIGLVLQLLFFYQYAINGINLYNRGSETWPYAYSVFYHPVKSWLPMLYNSNWAYNYWPNYIWALIFGSLLFFGFFRKKEFTQALSKNIGVLSVATTLLVFVAGLTNNQTHNSFVYHASALPSNTGIQRDLYRSADPASHSPGFLVYGPYVSLGKGEYEVVFKYKNSAPATETTEWVDIYNATSGQQLLKIPLKGTESLPGTQKVNFNVTQRKREVFEFRVYWNGKTSLELQNISVKIK